MIAYTLLFIWLASHIVCLYIAKKRNVKPTLLWRLIGVILGPLAIPLVFFLKKSMNPET